MESTFALNFLAPLMLLFFFILGFLAGRYLAMKKSTQTFQAQMENMATKLRYEIEGSFHEKISNLEKLKLQEETLKIRFQTDLAEKEKNLGQLENQFRQSSAQVASLEKEREIILSQQEKNESLFQEKIKVLKNEFELMAQKIFNEKHQVYRQESEKNLQTLLFPLKENLKEFSQKVEGAYQQESRERLLLKDELKRLMEIQNRMETETSNLTKALKGEVKAQGSWGEIMLQRILESAGLREGEEYVAEAKGMKLKDETGSHLRPDVLVMLPEGKHLVVDSKVSLSSYQRYIEASTPEEAQNSLNQFKLAISNHVQGLAGKKYHFNEKLEAPEFTLMFFPIEGAYSLALQADSDLFTYCWDRSIVVVGPTTLLATLKTVASLWRQERQNQNALKIAQESGKLYDKFVGLLEDFEALGRALANSHKIYEQSMGKLKTGRGNLINRTEALKLLGAKASKKIPAHLLEQDDSEFPILDNE